MPGTDGTDISNATATTTASSYEVCQRSGFRVPRGTLVREWTGRWVRPEVWEPRHPLEWQRAMAPEGPHATGNPEPNDRFIAGPVTVAEL